MLRLYFFLSFFLPICLFAEVNESNHGLHKSNQERNNVQPRDDASVQAPATVSVKTEAWEYSISLNALVGTGDSWTSNQSRNFHYGSLNVYSNYKKTHKFSLTLPYIGFDYDAEPAFGSEGQGSSDFGDIRLGYQFRSKALLPKLIKLSLGSDIKLPSASDKKRLGTGEFDYSFYMKTQYFHNNSKRLFWASKSSYTLRGRSDVFPMRNGFTQSFGVNTFSANSVLGASLRFKKRSSDFAQNDYGFSAYCSYRLSTEISALVHGYKMRKSDGFGITLTYML